MATSRVPRDGVGMEVPPVGACGPWDCVGVLVGVPVLGVNGGSRGGIQLVGSPVEVLVGVPVPVGLPVEVFVGLPVVGVPVGVGVLAAPTTVKTSDTAPDSAPVNVAV